MQNMIAHRSGLLSGVAGRLTCTPWKVRPSAAYSVDFLFLDGWKQLNLPMLKQLEPRLRNGVVVLADDLDILPKALAPCVQYVRNPANGYVSRTLAIGDGVELSARAG